MRESPLGVAVEISAHSPGEKKVNAMAFLKVAAGLMLAALLALAVGCADDSVPSSTSPKVGPNPLPTNPVSPPIAKIKSTVPAKPVSPSTSGPRLAIDVEGADFGEVPHNTIVAYSFSLKNVGSAPINLEPPFIRVREGC